MGNDCFLPSFPAHYPSQMNMFLNVIKGAFLYQLYPSLFSILNGICAFMAVLPLDLLSGICMFTVCDLSDYNVISTSSFSSIATLAGSQIKPTVNFFLYSLYSSTVYDREDLVYMISMT